MHGSFVSAMGFSPLRSVHLEGETQREGVRAAGRGRERVGEKEDRRAGGTIGSDTHTRTLQGSRLAAASYQQCILSPRPLAGVGVSLGNTARLCVLLWVIGGLGERLGERREREGEMKGKQSCVRQLWVAVVAGREAGRRAGGTSERLVNVLEVSSPMCASPRPRPC
ncbi:hypothetical protein E2C01_089935 [Portunus trituberculatus]|uniref:Uncharacterized protein n=1 Tax=Portunus trituberculatus TaxID=210409 RepID=A0A5B7JDD0_PORTR|nr:hypothetical protein [Portunus trituberculatus]